MQVDALDVLVAETAARLEREGRYARTRHFVQHGGVTVYDHCLRVAAMSCRLARALDLDVDTDALVRGALLHDYFLYDWHEKDDSHRLHGFTHPRRALHTEALQKGRPLFLQPGLEKPDRARLRLLALRERRENAKTGPLA